MPQEKRIAGTGNDSVSNCSLSKGDSSCDKDSKNEVLVESLSLDETNEFEMMVNMGLPKSFLTSRTVRMENEVKL